MATTTVRRGAEFLAIAALCAIACVALVVVAGQTNGATASVAHLMAVVLGVTATGLVSVGVKKIALALRAD
jgi:hypothetical protein